MSIEILPNLLYIFGAFIKTFFLEFPNMPDSFVLPFDIKPNGRKGVSLKYRSYIKF